MGTLGEINELCSEILKIDTHVLIQEFIEGKEYSCGCLRVEDDALVLPLISISPGMDFFSHESKYGKGISRCVAIPHDQERPVEKRMKVIAREIFNLLDYGPMARYDFIVSEEGKIYFLEANTLPGFKDGSLYPQMLQAGGYSLEKFILRLIVHEGTSTAKMSE